MEYIYSLLFFLFSFFPVFSFLLFFRFFPFFSLSNKMPLSQTLFTMKTPIQNRLDGKVLIDCGQRTQSVSVTLVLHSCTDLVEMWISASGMCLVMVFSSVIASFDDLPHSDVETVAVFSVVLWYVVWNFKEKIPFHSLNYRNDWKALNTLLIFRDFLGHVFPTVDFLSERITVRLKFVWLLHDFIVFVFRSFENFMQFSGPEFVLGCLKLCNNFESFKTLCQWFKIHSMILWHFLLNFHELRWPPTNPTIWTTFLFAIVAKNMLARG